MKISELLRLKFNDVESFDQLRTLVENTKSTVITITAQKDHQSLRFWGWTTTVSLCRN